MRWSAVGLIALTLSGCGAKYKADGPVLDNWNRVRGWSENDLSRARYSGQPPVINAPVVPVLAFGAHFDLDIQMRPTSDRWDQKQVARIDTPAGALWLALETRAGTLEQTLVADVPEIDAFMPELPLARKQSAFQVKDASTDEVLDLNVKYEDADGQRVELHVQSDPPYKFEKKRNAPVLGASEDSLIAVIDQAARQSAFALDLRVGGNAERMQKVGGFTPFQYVSTQSVGGLAIGSFTQIPTDVLPFDSTMAKIVVANPNGSPVVAAAPVSAKPDPLTTVLLANQGELQGCWTARVAEAPALAGQVLMAFKVTAGKAEGFSVISNTTADEALATCLTEKLGAIAFPEAIAGDVGFPFEFVAEKGLVLAKGGAAASEDDLPEADLPEADIPVAATRVEDAGGATRVEDAGVEDAGGATRVEGDLLDGDEVAAVAAANPYGPVLAHFDTVHNMASGNQVTMSWEVSRKGDRVYAVQHSDVRTLTYEYLVHHDALELARIAVTQFGQAVPTTEVSFSPALPDLRRSFDGRQVSRFVIDVNGQDNYATGTAEAWWTESGVKLKVVPEAPEWTVGRPMTTTINYSGGQAAVMTQRIE